MSEISSRKRLRKILKSKIGNDDMDGVCQVLHQAITACPPEQDPGGIALRLRTEFPTLVDAVEAALLRAEQKVEQATRSLEISSAELTDRNSALFSLTQEMSAVLQSLSQGIFMFNRSGKCLPSASGACQALLGVTPPGKLFTEALGLQLDSSQRLGDWLELVFAERILFEDLIALLPLQEKFGAAHGLEAEFIPVRNGEKKIESVLVVITDRRRELAARAEAENNLIFSQKILKLVKDRESYTSFRKSCEAALGLAASLSPASTAGEISAVKRCLHNVKGASTAFRADKVREHLHNCERTLILDFAGFCRDSAALVRAVRDEIRAFEADLERTLGSEFFRDEEYRTYPARQVTEFYQELQRTGVATELLTRYREFFLRTSLKDLFAPFDDQIRECAAQLGKRVSSLQIDIPTDLRVSAEKTGPLLNSLGNIFVNAVDHGIEPPALRVSLGKPEGGLISVSALLQEEPGPPRLLLTLRDDGQGVSLERVKQKLKESGRKDQELAAMEDSQLFRELFAEGFSTAGTVTEFSGRGLGLASVFREIETLGGSIAVASQPGIGTRFELAIPFAALV